MIGWSPKGVDKLGPKPEPLQENYVIPTKDLMFYSEKLNEASKQWLMAAIKEGDKRKLKQAHEKLKDLYGPVE